MANESKRTPRVETLATGNEVVWGEIADSNSAFVSAKLAEIGVKVARHNAVGDDAAEIIATVREIATRATLCIVCGGLGPTEDDLTTDAMASAAGVGVVEDAEARVRLEARLRASAWRMSPNNLRSVRVPVGSTVLQNEMGSAPGYVTRIGGCDFVVLPGVPREFRFFVTTHVTPRARALCPDAFTATEVFTTFGEGESLVAEKVSPLGEAHPDVEIGYLARMPYVLVKMTAAGASEAEARGRLAAPMSAARARLGALVLGAGEMTMGEATLAALAERKLTLATAESCTGGMVGEMITAVAGSSRYYKGGVVAYANEVKRSQLGVFSGTLAAHGAVSRETAAQMALGALTRLDADVAVSATGIAGPGGGSDEKPVGLVCFGLATRDAEGTVQLRSFERRFSGDRARVRVYAATTALDLVRRVALNVELPDAT